MGQTEVCDVSYFLEFIHIYFIHFEWQESYYKMCNNCHRIDFDDSDEGGDVFDGERNEVMVELLILFLQEKISLINLEVFSL